MVEQSCNIFKQWRSIATRYDKVAITDRSGAAVHAVLGLRHYGSYCRPSPSTAFSTGNPRRPAALCPDQAEESGVAGPPSELQFPRTTCLGGVLRHRRVRAQGRISFATL
ncbi:hypothetical protein QFZ69_004735 [Arthrobacter sp. V1I7]|nr:hypothetical protein [Arthrobacter sp. V1I7]